MNNAAQIIKESISDISFLDAKFAELVIWYEGFTNSEKLIYLKYDIEDLEILNLKRNTCRFERDFKTSDFLRNVLTSIGITVKDR